jgi:aryl-alcohol dehydrogenase-like predicted oxidoreductase
MDTKYSPRIKETYENGVPQNHSPEGLREAMKLSYAALKTEKVDMWYLHAPDRSVPYVDTMREVNELYKQGMRNFRKASAVSYISLLCQENSTDLESATSPHGKWLKSARSVISMVG